jgi:hypothetical protein
MAINLGHHPNIGLSLLLLNQNYIQIKIQIKLLQFLIVFKIIISSIEYLNS